MFDGLIEYMIKRKERKILLRRIKEAREFNDRIRADNEQLRNKLEQMKRERE